MSKKTIIIVAVIVLIAIVLIFVIPWGAKKAQNQQNSSQTHQQELDIDVLTGKPIK